jgi:hypothetical protein
MALPMAMTSYLVGAAVSVMKTPVKTALRRARLAVRRIEAKGAIDLGSALFHSAPLMTSLQ